MPARLLPVQCRMARSALGWEIDRLAAVSGIPTEAVLEFEKGLASSNRATQAIRRSLEGAGIEFTETGGVQLRPKAEFVLPDQLSSENVD